MSSKAAIRYAKALFALCRDENRVREVRTELDALASLLGDHRDLRDALLTPLHPADERKAVLNAVAERIPLSPVMRNFGNYLIDQRRLVALNAIVAEYARLADEEEGLLTAEVTSATELDTNRRERLREALSDRTGRSIRLDLKLEPDLIAGAIAKVGDLVIDGSLRTQLAQLRANLMKGS